jgi:hypothetical protein
MGVRGLCACPEQSAEEIMARVAANQDRAQQERKQYIYDQHVKVAIRRTNGKLAREEVSDLLVTPDAKGVQRKEQTVRGRYWKKGHYHEFHSEPIPESGSLDGSLAHAFKDELLNDDSKDGLAKDLFPLTTDEQKDMEFELAGEKVIFGRPAYRIKFRPAKHSDFGWAGEALIDEEELQPVSVYTRLSRRIPLFVRTMLGTDLPGLGFSTTYKRVDKNIWFPASFGTEFRLHAVFFINRTISVSMESRNFKKTSAESTIQYESENAPP